MALSELRIDSAQLLGLIVGLLIHGCYISVFAVTVYILHHKKHVSHVIMYALVSLFLLSSTNICLGIVDTYTAFITHRDSPGTIVRLNDFSNPLPVVANILYAISVLVADLLLVWRLHIIWPNNRSIYILVGTLVACMTGCGFAIAYFEVAQVVVGDARYLHSTNIMSMVGFGFVFLTNLVVTCLIAGRLWHVGRQVIELGSQSHLIYRRITHIFISSGGIYLSVILMQVVIYAMGMGGVIYFFLRCNPSIVALVPTLIILQINLPSLSPATETTVVNISRSRYAPRQHTRPPIVNVASSSTRLCDLDVSNHVVPSPSSMSTGGSQQPLRPYLLARSSSLATFHSTSSFDTTPCDSKVNLVTAHQPPWRKAEADLESIIATPMDAAVHPLSSYMYTSSSPTPSRVIPGQAI